VPDAFAVIADRHGSSIYSSNAQVVVYKLVGNFDPREAITHGYVDSQKLPAWQPTNASMADFGGFPSSIVEGTYRDGD
ncbi:LpqN/LpqT family lipoprotein, partial [Mycobacterium avium]